MATSAFLMSVSAFSPPDVYPLTYTVKTLAIGDLQRIVYLDAEVAYRAFQLRVSEEKLNRPQVLGAAVDQRGLRAPQRMGAEVGWIQFDETHPSVDDPCVLARRDVFGRTNPAGEQKTIAGKIPLGDPRLQRIACLLGQLEANGSPGLPLQHGCPGIDLLSVDNIADPQSNQITPAQLAVDSQIE